MSTRTRNHNTAHDFDADLLNRRFLVLITAIVSAGMLAIPVFAFQAGAWGSFFSVTAFGIAAAGASLLVGGLTGFLFGIPRKLQRERADLAESSEGSEDIDRNGRAVYGANTNLEQISDWLTKILVGVGLTQIGKLGGALGKAGDVAAPGFGGFEASRSFGIAVIVFFVVSGFLLGYLWTRLYLGRALTEADRTYSLKKQLGELEQQSHADAIALQCAVAQLSGDGGGRPSRSKLDETVKAASRETRSHIYYRAQLQRWRNWRDNASKPTMERTIPIFQALVESDREDRYHANHGQLGFALKDQRNPDWQGAEHALSRAITIRGNARDTDWHIYEFNRAICRIMQDDALAKNVPSTEETKASIVDDIRTAIEDEWVRGVAKDDGTIKKWLSLNELKLSSLR